MPPLLWVWEAIGCDVMSGTGHDVWRVARIIRYGVGVMRGSMSGQNKQGI